MVFGTCYVFPLFNRKQKRVKMSVKSFSLRWMITLILDICQLLLFFSSRICYCLTLTLIIWQPINIICTQNNSTGEMVWLENQMPFDKLQKIQASDSCWISIIRMYVYSTQQYSWQYKWALIIIITLHRTTVYKIVITTTQAYHLYTHSVHRSAQLK